MGLSSISKPAHALQVAMLKSVSKISLSLFELYFRPGWCVKDTRLLVCVCGDYSTSSVVDTVLPKVLEWLCQIFCFCYTLQTFGLENKEWIWDDRSVFKLNFLIFTSRCYKHLGTFCLKIHWFFKRSNTFLFSRCPILIDCLYKY